MHIGLRSTPRAREQDDRDNDFGIPATGSPLYAATIGVEDLGRSVALYTEAMGLDVLDRRRLSGRAFEAHWRLPAGASAAAAVLCNRDFPVGRLVLLQFDARQRERVRIIPGQRFFGFVTNGRAASRS